ncbi:MAG TPA: hypothetical protein DC049_20225, partial [Spirochaetia bacterium]|nr:hypothetical protein [Spirochaetia bacterium]
ALSYLVDNGHRNIGLIAGSNIHHADRVAGYEMALRAFSIPYRPEYVIRLDRGFPEDGYQAMRALIQQAPEITAVFADTDIKAGGAINAVTDAGFTVPGDFSILGYDDYPGSAEFNPPLTTLRIPYYEIGQQAVKLLNERIRHGGMDVKGVVLDTVFIRRDSCGPAVLRKKRK